MYFFFVGLSGRFIFFRLGWDEYKKVSVFFFPLFHSHSSYLLLLCLGGCFFTWSRPLFLAGYPRHVFFLRLMGLINHLYGCKFLCLHPNKLVLLEYRFLAKRPFAGVHLRWVFCILFYLILFGVIVFVFVFWCTSILFSKDTFNYESFPIVLCTKRFDNNR